MKVVILCGGRGLRMHQLTEEIPKPLVPVNGKPMLWHIMKIYKHYGFNDFVLLLGYKGEKIKEYFYNDPWLNHNFSIDTATNQMEYLQPTEQWKITFFDTGTDTMTGSRIKRARSLLENKTFMMTYGDGLSDIDIRQLYRFHKEMNKIATVTGIDKKSQYGTLMVKNNLAMAFDEKEKSIGIINGGFFVLEPQIFDYLEDDTHCVFEKEPMTKLCHARELAVYRHDGFWTACDTLSDIVALNNLCREGKDLWKVW